MIQQIQDNQGGEKGVTKGMLVNFYLPIFNNLIKRVTHFSFARLS